MAPRSHDLPQRPAHAPASALRTFLRSEAAGGILLMVAAGVAVIVANGPLAAGYFAVLGAKLGPLSVQHWINDALMALFFLLAGLEIKREFVDGHLASWSARRLPIAAAAGGMVVPALIYLACAGRGAGLARGWAIPAATDIAFAIGVLALVGRVPASLKLFLTTVAIVDDLGAVAIIALAYTATIDLGAVAAALGILAVMFALNRGGQTRLWPYMLLAAGLWVVVYRSGVHATVAGVLAALAIPLRRSPGTPDDSVSALHRLEHKLQPWVAYGIVPLFGFANAGVSFAGVTAGQLLSPVTLGIAGGLFLGKQAGIFATLRAMVALGYGKRPSGANWWQVYGVALVCGIGFTMSLFIGGLAFADAARADEVKFGVLGGSLLSAIAGFAVLRLTAARRDTARRAR